MDCALSRDVRLEPLRPLLRGHTIDSISKGPTLRERELVEMEELDLGKGWRKKDFTAASATHTFRCSTFPTVTLRDLQPPLHRSRQRTRPGPSPLAVFEDGVGLGRGFPSGGVYGNYS